jgi:hypothetical protein
MAFPGTYNFSYYKGDTLEFRVYPKDSSGTAFDLTGYDNATSPIFTIATSRGAESTISAYAEIIGSGSNAYILCTIRPEDGDQLTAGTQYVYDIEINKTGDDYDFIFTILTGSITVTEQVGVSDPGVS